MYTRMEAVVLRRWGFRRK